MSVPGLPLVKGLCLGELQCPASIGAFLRRAGKLIGSYFTGHFARLDRILFRCGIALLGRGHQRRINNLPTHGEMIPVFDLPVEIGEQHILRPGLGPLLAEEPDRVSIGRRRAKIKTQKAQPAHPVPEPIFHSADGNIVLRRQHQDLKQRHWILGRATVLRTVSLGQRSDKCRAKLFEVDNPAQFLQRIAAGRKPLQLTL